MDVELNQSDCFKMMSFIKTSNLIALKVQDPLCLHKNLPLVSYLGSPHILTFKVQRQIC